MSPLEALKSASTFAATGKRIIDAVEKALAVEKTFVEDIQRIRPGCIRFTLLGTPFLTRIEISASGDSANVMTYALNEKGELEVARAVTANAFDSLSNISLKATGGPFALSPEDYGKSLLLLCLSGMRPLSIPLTP